MVLAPRGFESIIDGTSLVSSLEDKMKNSMLYAILAPYLWMAHQTSAEYDYIIIGGGTAGLTIAARLTEQPDVSVLVLEAGYDHSNDTKVLSPGLYTSMYGDPEYDWNYKTVPQVYANDQVVAHPRGKQLGGSSAINFMFWTHASQRDINNWGDLGNANWSWASLEPYFSKSESYIGPSTQVELDLKTNYIEPKLHGRNGPIKNTFPDIYGLLDEAWPYTFENLGIGVSSDPRDGIALGGYTNLINMDLEGRKRSYAATGYYLPVSKRPNLTVLTGVLVEKILLDTAIHNGKVTAVGVQYSVALNPESSKTAKAKTEVILSAGSIGSPQILELSGIGDPTILTKFDIDTIVPNSNVGENLQDHIYIPIGYKVIPGIITLDNFSNPDYFDAAYEEYITNGSGPLATTGASSGLLSCSQIDCKNIQPPNLVSVSPDTSENLAAQYRLLSKYFHSEAVTQELTVTGGMSPQYANDTTKLFTTTLAGNFFTLLGVLEHPFSRGSIHVSSADPTVYPEIDPRYLSHPFDLEVLSEIALHLQKIAQASPLSNFLEGNGTVFQPGYHELNNRNVRDWIRKYLQSEYHPAGTCAMLPRNKGGVVDERFKVYDVEKLRIVDASVFPLLPRGNLQTLVYAIAERAADWIKEDKKS